MCGMPGWTSALDPGHQSTRGFQSRMSSMTPALLKRRSVSWGFAEAPLAITAFATSIAGFRTAHPAGSRGGPSKAGMEDTLGRREGLGKRGSAKRQATLYFL